VAKRHPDAPWKKAERSLASLFGTRRRPLSGSNQGGGSDDAIHPKLHLESKWARSHALWTLFRETREKAKREGKTPVIGLKEKGSPGILLVVHSNNLQEVLEALLEAKDKLDGQEEDIR